MYHKVADLRRSVSFPHHPLKHTSASVLTAAALLSDRGVDTASILRGATAVVICFQHRCLLDVTKKYGGKPIKGLSGEAAWLKKRGLIAASPGGVGAPSLAVLMEELAVCGIRTMIALGISGAIGDTLSAGDIIIPSMAIRDEGTSHHYIPSELPAHPTSEVIRRLTASLGARSLRFASGPVWTTDAPFRETEEEVRKYREQGVLAVDMECATLFSVAQALGLGAACGLVISDSVSGGVWRPTRELGTVHNVLSELSAAAVEALIS